MTNKPILALSSSPHVRAKDSTGSIMRDVCIALLPALIASVYFFGLRALTVTLVSILACVFFEWGYRRLRHLDCTIGDGSAVVTGMLLAFVCPPSVPYWALIIGDLFAIVLVKQLFGGIGKNIMNPALLARAFLFSWPVIMTTWVAPGTRISVLSNFTDPAALDGLTAATPLAAMSGGALPGQSLLNQFIGNIGGCIGETSALLLLLGGVYLVVRKVITPRIPLSFIGTVAVLTFLFPRGNDNLTWMAMQLCSGGLMLGAIFMATDYVTSPVTAWGQVIYGVGCGALTVLIRYFGSYNEGVSYAILIMNACAVLLDKVGRPRRFGVQHPQGVRHARSASSSLTGVQKGGAGQ